MSVIPLLPLKPVFVLFEVPNVKVLMAGIYSLHLGILVVELCIWRILLQVADWFMALNFGKLTEVKELHSLNAV